MRKLLVLITALFIVGGCSAGDHSKPAKDTNLEQSNKGGNGKDHTEKKEVPNKPGPTTGNGSSTDSADGGNGTNIGTGTPIQTGAYMPAPNQLKKFKGTGNEYAAEVERVFSKENAYLAAVAENGGTSILRIYQLDKNGISIVYEEPEYYSEDAPDINAYKRTFKPRLILPNPLKPNQQFDGWTVKETDATVKVPYRTLSNAIILEKIGEDGSVVQNIWAPGLGIVKKSFYLKDSSGNETIVTTELEEVEPLDR
ncbi:hypothetical protein [Bacillus sp. FJAT-27445]|uniref:hypothetical protein n=1 Tax=Bacillus sp. FJAT-27445 TaxID=1679166 RepID=UPI0007436EA3|nr:hypothetical protein [Bacillus sp. FJAT-27445]